MTIPSHHTVGDVGHTTDHNAIIDALTSLEVSVTSLQGVTTGIFYVAGGNVSNISGTTTTWAKVNLPTGDRSSAVDTLQFLHGSNKIFWLDGYAHPRVKNDDPTHIPWIVDSVSGQTANLQEWRVNGSAKASIASDGTVVAPNVTPTAWTNLTLAAGYSNDSFGFPPQWRKKDDRIELRGVVAKSNGSNIAAGTTQIATLPTGLWPQQHSYGATAAQWLSDVPVVRIQALKDGTLWCVSNFSTAWVSLDNFSYPLS